MSSAKDYIDRFKARVAQLQSRLLVGQDKCTVVLHRHDTKKFNGFRITVIRSRDSKVATGWVPDEDKPFVPKGLKDTARA